MVELCWQNKNIGICVLALQKANLAAWMGKHMLLEQTEASQQGDQRPTKGFQQKKVAARECQIEQNAFLEGNWHLLDLFGFIVGQQPTISDESMKFLLSCGGVLSLHCIPCSSSSIPKPSCCCTRWQLGAVGKGGSEKAAQKPMFSGEWPTQWNTGKFCEEKIMGKEAGKGEGPNDVSDFLTIVLGANLIKTA